MNEGKALVQVTKDCLRRRVPIPPPFDNPPSIGPEFNLFVWAFNELSREREPSTVEDKRVKVHRITYRSIREWAEFQGFAHDADLMLELYTLVRALDTIWVETETKQLKQKASRHGKPA